MKLPTKRVVLKATGQEVVINATDYDERIYAEPGTPVSAPPAPEPAPAPEPEPMADPEPEPLPEPEPVPEAEAEAEQPKRGRPGRR
jgi:hypothetical protein